MRAWVIKDGQEMAQAAAGIAPVAKSMAAHTPWPCTAATGPAPAAAVDAAPTMPASLALAAGSKTQIPGWYEMPTTTQPAMTWLTVNDQRREALFASALQPSDSPTAAMVAEAISWTLRRFGARGCAGRMAQEFGDHPDAAARRMRWVRQLAQPAGSGRHEVRAGARGR